MKYIECPKVYEGREVSLFLAGGISGCKIWQNDLVKLLEDTSLVLINPRRKNFDIKDLTLEKKQITWEYEHLERASAVSFWFPSETVCPITLYELGKISQTDKPLFIGIDRNYTRINDISIQTKLIRPDVKVVYSLEGLAEQIKCWERTL
ncbi:MAG: nucleoside 2-deoxyribosyltransferase domain-containing protein [archaeon]